jgi:hypothetical protein
LLHCTRPFAGFCAIAAAAALALIPSSAPAAPINLITSQADQAAPCEITLPGGSKAVVTESGGRETARPADASDTSAAGGMFSVNAGGHQLLLPATAMASLRSGAADPSEYDTTALAESQCGLAAPAAVKKQPGQSDYQLGRLTINTLGDDGNPTPQVVLLTNLDNQNLARPFLVTWGGSGRIAVPEGHYAAILWRYDSATKYRFVIDPDFTVTDGTAITLDLRTATVTAQPPTTPRPSVLESTSLGIAAGDGGGTRASAGDWLDYFNLTSTPATFGFNPTEPVKHGKFAVSPAYEFTSPADAADPYQYHVVEPFDHVPAAFPATVDQASLATVTRNYNAPGTDRQVLSANTAATRWDGTSGLFGLHGLSEVMLGASRKEYFTAGKDLIWLTILDGTSTGWDEMSTSPRSYTPGEHITENFFSGAQHPGVRLGSDGAAVICAACSTAGQLQFNIYPFNDNTPGTVAVQDTVPTGQSESTSLQLLRNGTEISSSLTAPLLTSATVPSGRARYQLVEKTDRAVTTLPLSPSSQTTWTFTADPGHGPDVPANWSCVDGSGDCSPLPMLFAYYDTDSSLTNSLTPGPHTLHLDVDHQERSVAPAVTGAAVSLSYDGGATWTPAHTSGGNGRFSARFTAPATGGDGYVAVRVSAWDGAGNRIDQTVLRAYQEQETSQ